MKSKYLACILSLFAVISCGKGTMLKVTFDKDLEGSATLYNTITQQVDSIRFSESVLLFSSKEVHEPTLFYLMFDQINDINRPIYIILSDQETHINLDELVAANTTTHKVKDLYPNRPRFIVDPNNNEEFYKFQDLWFDFYSDVTKPELDIAQRKEIHSKFINNSESVILENQDKLVSAMIIEYLMNNNLIELDKIQLFYSYLSTDIHKSVIGTKISHEVGFEKNIQAPLFSFNDYHGESYALERLKGKKVLLHFWSSTCAPCIEEIPALKRLALAKRDLVIIYVSIDTDRSKWISGMKRLGISDMINFCDFEGINGEITSDYHINSVPANYLIDEQGRIVLKTQTIDAIIDNLENASAS